MEITISPLGCLDILPASREGGGIQDQDAIFRSGICEVGQMFKNIRLLKSDVLKRIQPRVLSCAMDCLSRTIDPENLQRTSPHGIQGKPAVVAETVENTRFPAILTNMQVIHPLIEVEACLLSFQGVNPIAETVLLNLERTWNPAQSSPSPGEGLKCTERRFVPFHDAGGVEHFLQGVANDRKMEVHAVRESLDDERSVVSIDDQPGKKISFPVNESVRVRGGIQELTKTVGLFYPVYEEGGVGRDPFPREKAECDQRIRMEEPYPEENPSGGQKIDEVTGDRTSADLLDLIAEDPLVSAQNSPILFLPENDLLWRLARVHANQGIEFRFEVQGTPGRLFEFQRVFWYLGDMQQQRSPFACVIFDIDGTLTRTNDLIFASFNFVAQKYLGRSFAPEEIIALFGPPEEGAILQVFGPERVDVVLEDLLSFYAAHHSAMASAHSGIVEILDFLKCRGTKLAVFTGKGRQTTAITLRALELHEYFDLIVSGNDVTRHKPDPEGIFKVLREFSVSPGQALMVGDSINDVRAARAAGVRIAAVLWDCYDPARMREAQSDYLFERVADLRKWFMSDPKLGQAPVN